MQRNWIGRSEGARVDFTLVSTGEKIPVFTTHPETLWGCTYMVLAVEHPLVESIIGRSGSGGADLRAFVTLVKRLGRAKRGDVGLEKEGVPTGEEVVNPVNGRRIPPWPRTVSC
jgi:leucyl-tRNA synthetase